MSRHTIDLIEEAIEETRKVALKKHLTELEELSLNNYDYKNLPKKHFINVVLEKLNLHLIRLSDLDKLREKDYSDFGKYNGIGTLQLALKEPERFDKVYELLNDEDSKATFDWFIKYLVSYAFVGKLANKIFPPEVSEEEFFDSVKKLKIGKNGIINTARFKFISAQIATACDWAFGQYFNEKCSISKGDVVIDGGAFRGETSFWFISQGVKKVYAFEPDLFNYNILLKNIQINSIGDSIIPVNIVLSDSAGTVKIFESNSSMSSVNPAGVKSIQSITLDEFVKRNNIESVDFIKLDVEGSEMRILKGAIETIRKFKPKLAISIYHKPEDIVEIPEFLRGLLPGAKFYLSHKFFDGSEVILFANPRD